MSTVRPTTIVEEPAPVGSPTHRVDVSHEPSSGSGYDSNSQYDGRSSYNIIRLLQENPMTTSHFCDGKWKPGPVAACSKHTRLSKKQTSVYRSGDEAESSSGSGGDDSGASSGSDSD